MWFLCASILAVVFFQDTLAQESSHGQPQKPEIALTELSPPIFPPLARQARIAGDVQIQMKIRKDGSVASAEVVSGHPMLKQAALESARKSKFLCSGCSEEVNSYVLIYTFGFRNDGDCGYQRQRSLKCLNLWRCGGWQYKPREPVVGQLQDRVVVLADTTCVETLTANPSGG
jgi:TonB family protein